MLKLVGRFEKIGLEWIYAGIMLFAGIILVFLTPPFQVPDDYAHLFRSYQISEGIFVSPIKEYQHDSLQGKNFCCLSADVPESFYVLALNEELLEQGYPISEFEALEASCPIAGRKEFYSLSYVKKLFEVPLKADVTLSYPIPNTGTYAPVAYVPQAAAIFIARSLWDPTVGGIYYSARIGNLLFMLVCIFLSMRLLPEKKLLIFLISFMPMFLLETISCSADAVLYGLGILGTSFLLSLRKSAEPLSRMEIFCLCLLAVLLGVTKQVYGIILLCCFFLPKSKFSNKASLMLTLGGIFFLYLASSVVWMKIMKSGMEYVPMPSGVDVTAQISFIAQSPLEYLQIFFSACWENMYFYVQSFIGILGWLAVFFPVWFYVFYGVCLLIGAIYGNLGFSLWQRCLMLGGILLLVIVLHFHFYLTWTPVRADFIAGVQGRYFIPVALMAFSAVACKKRIPCENAIACLAAGVSVAMTVWATWEHFYV